MDFFECIGFYFGFIAESVFVIVEVVFSGAVGALVGGDFGKGGVEVIFGEAHFF